MLGSHDGKRMADPHWKVRRTRVVIVSARGKHLTINTQAQGIDELVAVSNDVHGVSLRGSMLI
jgi:hypothetical protein